MHGCTERLEFWVRFASRPQFCVRIRKTTGMIVTAEARLRLFGNMR